jgi:response regulator RpfG family c-di-GMP phosphodiesterase
MDGVSLVQFLKAHKKYKEIPVVAASVQTGRLRRRVTAVGVDQYIEQPIPRDLFIEKVKSFLSQATRSSDRVSTSFDAELKYADDLVVSTVLDISPSGILVETDYRTEKDVPVQIKMRLPGLKRSFVIGAQVVRQEEEKTETGFKTALRFSNVSTETKRKIEKFVLLNKMQGELKYYM